MPIASMNRSAKDDKVNLYTTPEWATEVLIEAGVLDDVENFWECCCGMGHISKVVLEAIEKRWEGQGKTLLSADLMDHGYGETGIDFLDHINPEIDCIITNPPFDKAGTHFKMLKHALSMASVKKVVFFMPVQFLETPDRAKWLEEFEKLVTMYSFADRVKCLTKGDVKLSKDNTAKHFAWFVFSKDHEGAATIGHLFKPDHMRRGGKNAK